jgi:nicotinamide mononucleotide adenylyltransferase
LIIVFTFIIEKWLISQKLDEGKPILICVRDIPPDDNNPFTTEQTIEMIKSVYEGKDVEIMKIPDIESINYGRGVGYKIIEHKPENDIYNISATEIRKKIINNDESWKNHIDKKIQNSVKENIFNFLKSYHENGAGI